MKTEAVLGLLLVCMLAVVGGQSDNKLTSSESRDARRSARKQKNNGCVYSSGSWGECNQGTKMMRRVKKLKRGPPTCKETLTELRKCKKSKVKSSGECKYSSDGPWSACDSVTLTKTKVKPLRKGPSTCNATVISTKKCKPRTTKYKCKYQKGEWSACTTVTPYEKTRTDSLRRDVSDQTCPATRTKTKACKGPGKIKCKFGPWSKLTPCVGGQRTKRREVLSGGEKCQSRAVRTKPC